MKATAAAAEAALEPPAFLLPLIDEYVELLRHQKRYSPHTCDAARRDLRALGVYCAQARIGTLEQIDLHVVRAYVARAHRDGREPASLQRYLSTFRSFFRHQLREGRMVANPAQTVRAPKLRRKLPGAIGADVLNAALDRAPEDGLALRDQCMVELFYSTGLRLAELQGLNVADVDGRQTEITITGKGRKQRIVMIGAPARSALDRWLAQRADIASAEEPALFVSTRGSRLSRGAIGTRLKAWAQRVGLGANLHPHRLRHSFATHVLESSGDLRAVQELLGHAHLSTTQIYTHLDWKRLASVYDEAHPRAKRRDGR
ncbi:MAG TPA: tyrosine recombinase XerC [Fontimonas sp.]